MRYPKPEKKEKTTKKEQICKCGSKLIVNKTHVLCNDCNQERLHGKDWRQAKIIRSKELSLSKDKLVASKQKTSKNRIKSVSKKQSKINNELARTYALIKETREPQCESCGAWHTQLPLSMSHTISVARCKELGKPELITDEQNIVIECFEAPSSFPKACHNIWESGTIQQKMKLKSFEQKLAFIKEFDPERYKEFLIDIENI